jgi:CheY-like chemotaxis protein
LEVLREIKGDPDLRSITVIMLTTSQSPLDVKAAYEAAVNCYVVKPIDLKKFYQVMRAIEQFWMTVVSRPTDGSPQLRLA